MKEGAETMKHSKFFALILTLTLLLVTALPLTASAASMASDGSITIRPPGILVLDAADFSAFKLYNVTGITGTAPNYRFAYEPTPAVIGFLKGLSATQRSAYGVTTDPNTGAAAEAAAAEEFRIWLQLKQETHDDPAIVALARVMVNAGVFSTGGINTAAKQADGSIKFTGLDYGYYLVTGKGLPVEDPPGPPEGAHSEKVISRGMLVNVPGLTRNNSNIVNGWDKDVSIKLKADAPKIDKEVWNHNYGTTPKDAPGWKDWTDVNIGDTVYFKHTATVPDMTGYDSYQFIVHDIMSRGLTFTAPGNMTVSLVKTGMTTRTLSRPADYTVTAAPATVANATSEYFGGTKITITFVDFEQWNAYAGGYVEIIYEAVLNENAIIGKPGNPNKVWLEYSNNPNDGGVGTGETPEDEVRVYTFDMKIYKYTGDTVPGTKLPGAEFELSRKTGATTYGPPLAFIELTGDPDYDYRLAKPGETPTTTTLITNADGYIRIKGLDAGEYGLKETKAPPGYNLLPGWITSVIVHEAPNAGDSHLLVGAASEQQQVVNVQNNAGGQLPGTGGIGTCVIFGAGGLMALLLCTAYAVYRKKKTLGVL